MTTATAQPAADLDALRSRIETQAAVVAEAEQVVARRREWDAEQRTTASAAGLREAERDLRFYRKHLLRLEGDLAAAQGTEVSR